ncbi:MAG: lytic murein transglycosylase [Rhodobacterales bacterium]|nr:lytic murein transglycosylase [Rhodobacterales bacterium]
MRFFGQIGCVLAGLLIAGPVTAQTTTTPEAQVDEVVIPTVEFQDWIAGFRARALQSGITAETLDAGLARVEYLPDVVRKDRSQNEFTKTIWDYLDTAVSDGRIELGQTALRENAALLDEIEARYGVDRHVVVAIWGLESSYGSYRGDISTISAMATLAFDGRRGRFFENQLMMALRILQDGDVAPANMKGSWAGAMGHTQFMPTSWDAYAVDFNGDGKRDIWSDDPTDALASTAAFLAGFGWTTGQPWGVEVRLPAGFDYTFARDTNRQTTDYWASIGVLGADGHPVVYRGTATIVLPAGARGAAFMLFRNFNVLEHYNTADAYVIGVGHLADRLRGGPAIQAAWPRDDRALTFDERKELQMRLNAAEFGPLAEDGLVGPRTISAVRSWQKASGMIPDGYASLMALNRLRDMATP